MNTLNRGIGMTSQRTRDRLVARLREEGIRNEAVLDVIRNTPRHLFVDEALASRAYEDTALPIGYNQTISQPYVVAAMTDLIVSSKPKKVLEIGTGSGYQAAILAPLVEKVYTVAGVSFTNLKIAVILAAFLVFLLLQTIVNKTKIFKSFKIKIVI